MTDAKFWEHLMYETYDYIVLIKARGNFFSFQIMAGILSGPNALEALSCLVAEFNSESVKEEVFIFCVSEIGTLGRVSMSGTLAGLPRRF